jgi:hypothetical protein
MVGVSAPSTPDRDAARILAAAAFHAALAQDWPAANKAMNEAGRASPNVIALMLVTFCDTAIAAQREMAGLPPLEDGHGEEVARPGWFNVETGQLVTDADAMPPALRWAGQLVAARAALDYDGFQALLSAMPSDGFKRGEYAATLLEGCAAMTALVRRGGAR